MTKKLDSKRIEIVEDLPLDGIDKWYVLLAVTDYKKGSWLQMKSDPWREGDASHRVPSERIDLLKKQLDALGLYYELSFRDTDAGLFQPDESSGKRKRYNQICDVFIGSSKTALNQLVDAYKKWDEKQLGYALDYPETAVQAYRTTETLSPDDLPANEIENDVIRNAQFMFSKANYKEEAEFVARWLEVLKRSSNIIYNDLSKHYL